MPFEISETSEGYFEVTAASSSNAKTLLPKFTLDSMVSAEYSGGKVSGTMLICTENLDVIIDVKFAGELTGPYSGNLKDGLQVDFKGTKSCIVRVLLKNGNEVWINVDGKDKKVTTLAM